MHFSRQNLRYGIRLLGKSRAFTAIALLTLALGMGATTAIFSVVDTVLLKPLPFSHSESLLVIWEKNPTQNRFRLAVAPVNFLAWQKQSRTLTQIAAVQDIRSNLTGGPNGRVEPEELKIERVSADLFPLLGVQAIVGRVFEKKEDVPGNANFAVLSYNLWQRKFAADPEIAGKQIRLRDQPFLVLGVLPPGFAVIQTGVDVFLPLALNSADTRTANNRYLVVIARRGGTLEQVRAEMETIGTQMEQTIPALDRGWRPSVFVLNEELVGGVRQSLLVLAAAVGCLLLIACANVANLLLSRGSSRGREIALRAALGAPRGNIVALFLTESLMLALAGGLAGLLLAVIAIHVLAHGGPANVPRLAEATIDFRVFGFTLAASLLTGMLSGAAPAMQGSRSSLSAALNEGGRGGLAASRPRRLRNALVIAEVALAVMVLIAAGLLMQSFLRLRAVNPGFDPSGVLTVRLPLAGGRNATADQRIVFFRQVSERIRALPGVRAVGAVSALPLTGFGYGSNFAVQGRPDPGAEELPLALLRTVTPSYFRTMGIPLLAGRAPMETDTSQSPAVVVVNQALAKHYWPNGGAIGQRIAITQMPGQPAEIVGVVGDVKPDRMESDDWPALYVPYPQTRSTVMTLVIRTESAPLALASAVAREVHALDPEQPLVEMRTMEDLVDSAVAPARFNAELLGSFAVIAFLLAAVGIYGVISYDVSQRTNEIGIRMALGAQPEDVRRMILGQGGRLAVYGIVAGLLGASILTRWMGAMLFGVNPTDAATFAAISISLAAVALAASYLPSRRAMALQPVTALRHE
jgi:putative ABC transport system permease protein